MPVNYSCDKCGNEISNSIDAIRIVGGKNYYVLCESCWENIENIYLTKKEVSSVEQK